MELVEKTGVCKFCGQNKIVEVPDYMNEEEINEEASKECYCVGAKNYKAELEQRAIIEQQKMSARGTTLELFHEDFPVIEKLLNEAIDPLADKKIKKLSITTDDGVRANIKWNGGIEVERVDTEVNRIKTKINEINNA